MNQKNIIIKKIFYKYTKLPLDLIKIILKYIKCSLCNNLSVISCIYCNNYFCNRCYSPFYNQCVCSKCSYLLF